MYKPGKLFKQLRQLPNGEVLTFLVNKNPSQLREWIKCPPTREELQGLKFAQRSQMRKETRNCKGGEIPDTTVLTLVDCCLAANKDIALSVVIHARPSILKYYDTAKQENRKKIIIIFTRLSVEDLRFFIETYAHDRYLFKQLAWDCAWRKLTNHVRVLLSVGADLVGENFDLFFHSGEIENTIELIHLLMSHGCVFSNVGNRTLESLLLYIVQEPARLDDLTDIAIILESSGAYLDPTKTLCLSTMDMVRAHYEVKMRPIYVRAAYTIRRAATEILYRPGGIGYHQAMNNFFELARRL